jgi:hypothetical protein
MMFFVDVTKSFNEVDIQYFAIFISLFLIFLSLPQME